MVRTSQSHPLLIATIPVGSKGGAIGVTFAPGKYQERAMTGAWSRDLDTDLTAIKEWGASYLISLIERWEFDELRINSLGERAAAHGLHWYGLPIVDGAAPTTEFLNQWSRMAPALCSELRRGKRIVVHCKGGLGRAGTVACMLLMESGQMTDPIRAMEAVRKARPGAIETAEQEYFIRAWGSRNR